MWLLPRRLADTSTALAKRNVANVGVLRLIGLSTLLDTWMEPHKKYGDMLQFSSDVYVYEFLVTIDFHWVKFFPFLCESLQWLCGLGKFTRAPIDIKMSSKLVKFQFWVTLTTKQKEEKVTPDCILAWLCHFLQSHLLIYLSLVVWHYLAVVYVC